MKNIILPETNPNYLKDAANDLNDPYALYKTLCDRIKGELALSKKKEVRVFILVNTLTSVQKPVYSNHIEMFVWHCRNYPEIKFYFLPPDRMSIDSARNTAADLAMDYECDWLLFLDDDVLVPPSCLSRLIEDNKDITAGLTIIRGMPFNVMGFKYGKKTKTKRNVDFYNDLPLAVRCKRKHANFIDNCPSCQETPLQKMVPLDAVGFSLCLIKVDLIKKLSKPYFLTGTGHTEDVYFCLKAQEEVGKKKVSIFMDTSIQTGHLVTAEPVGWKNRILLRRYYNDVSSLLPKPPKMTGRDEKYISRNLKLL